MVRTIFEIKHRALSITYTYDGPTGVQLVENYAVKAGAHIPFFPTA